MICIGGVLLCFFDPRVRKIRNEASRCPWNFSRTLRFYYVASSPGSPLPHLLDGHRKLVGCSAIPARSCPVPFRYHWGSTSFEKAFGPALKYFNDRAGGSR